MIGHFAGTPITLDGRYVRQLCAWCGDVLVDVDVARIAVPVDQLNPDGSITVATWPEGSIVCVDGAASWSVPVASAANTFVCGFIETSAAQPELTAAELDERRAQPPDVRRLFDQPDHGAPEPSDLRVPTDAELRWWRGVWEADVQAAIDQSAEPDHGPSTG